MDKSLKRLKKKVGTTTPTSENKTLTIDIPKAVVPPPLLHTPETPEIKRGGKGRPSGKANLVETAEKTLGSRGRRWNKGSSGESQVTRGRQSDIITKAVDLTTVTKEKGEAQKVKEGHGVVHVVKEAGTKPPRGVDTVSSPTVGGNKPSGRGGPHKGKEPASKPRVATPGTPNRGKAGQQGTPITGRVIGGNATPPERREGSGGVQPPRNDSELRVPKHSKASQKRSTKPPHDEDKPQPGEGVVYNPLAKLQIPREKDDKRGGGYMLMFPESGDLECTENDGITRKVHDVNRFIEAGKRMDNRQDSRGGIDLEDISPGYRNQDNSPSRNPMHGTNAEPQMLQHLYDSGMVAREQHSRRHHEGGHHREHRGMPNNQFPAGMPMQYYPQGTALQAQAPAFQWMPMQPMVPAMYPMQMMGQYMPGGWNGGLPDQQMMPQYATPFAPAMMEMYPAPYYEQPHANTQRGGGVPVQQRRNAAFQIRHPETGEVVVDPSTHKDDPSTRRPKAPELEPERKVQPVQDPDVSPMVRRNIPPTDDNDSDSSVPPRRSHRPSRNGGGMFVPQMQQGNHPMSQGGYMQQFGPMVAMQPMNQNMYPQASFYYPPYVNQGCVPFAPMMYPRTPYPPMTAGYLYEDEMLVVDGMNSPQNGRVVNGPAQIFKCPKTANPMNVLRSQYGGMYGQPGSFTSSWSESSGWMDSPRSRVPNRPNSFCETVYYIVERHPKLDKTANASVTPPLSDRRVVNPDPLAPDVAVVDAAIIVASTVVPTDPSELPSMLASEDTLLKEALEAVSEAGEGDEPVLEEVEANDPMDDFEYILRYPVTEDCITPNELLYIGFSLDETTPSPNLGFQHVSCTAPNIVVVSKEDDDAHESRGRGVPNVSSSSRNQAPLSTGGSQRNRTFERSSDDEVWRREPEPEVVHVTPFRRSNLSREEQFKRTVRSLLNKLTVEKFMTVSDGLVKLYEGLTNEDDVDMMAELVLEKAVTEMTYSDMYADLAMLLKFRYIDAFDIGEHDSMFYRRMIDRCLSSFYDMCSMAPEQVLPDDGIDGPQEDPKEEDSGAACVEAEASEDVQPLRKVRKRTLLGTVRFVGELLLRRIFPRSTFENIVNTLLRMEDESSGFPHEFMIESFVELLTTIGYSFEDSEYGASLIDYYMDRLTMLRHEANYSLRIVFMIQDLIDLRKNKWVKKIFREKVKSVADIHLDAEEDDLKGGAIHVNQEGKFTTAGSAPNRSYTEYLDDQRWAGLMKTVNGKFMGHGYVHDENEEPSFIPDEPKPEPEPEPEAEWTLVRDKRHPAVAKKAAPLPKIPETVGKLPVTHKRHPPVAKKSTPHRKEDDTGGKSPVSHKRPPPVASRVAVTVSVTTAPAAKRWATLPEMPETVGRTVGWPLLASPPVSVPPVPVPAATAKSSILHRKEDDTGGKSPVSHKRQPAATKPSTPHKEDTGGKSPVSHKKQPAAKKSRPQKKEEEDTYGTSVSCPIPPAVRAAMAAAMPSALAAKPSAPHKEDTGGKSPVSHKKQPAAKKSRPQKKEEEDTYGTSVSCPIPPAVRAAMAAAMPSALAAKPTSPLQGILKRSDRSDAEKTQKKDLVVRFAMDSKVLTGADDIVDVFRQKPTSERFRYEWNQLDLTREEAYEALTRMIDICVNGKSVATSEVQAELIGFAIANLFHGASDILGAFAIFEEEALGSLPNEAIDNPQLVELWSRVLAAALERFGEDPEIVLEQIRMPYDFDIARDLACRVLKAMKRNSKQWEYAKALFQASFSIFDEDCSFLTEL